MELEKRLRSEKGDANVGLGLLNLTVSLGLFGVTVSVISVSHKIDRLTNELKQERNINEKDVPTSNVTQITQADLTPFIVNPQ